MFNQRKMKLKLKGFITYTKVVDFRSASADVKEGGVYPTDQQLIFAEPLFAGFGFETLTDPSAYFLR